MTPITALHRQVDNPNGAIGGHDPLTGDESSRTVRILVVDDDAAMREMVVDYLEAHHMRAVGASGRQEMASHLANGDPSLVARFNSFELVLTL